MTNSEKACLINQRAKSIGLGPVWARQFKRSVRRGDTLRFRRGRYLRRAYHKKWMSVMREMSHGD